MLSSRLPFDFSEQEILDEYRLKALKRFGFGFSPFLLPFFIIELMSGRYLLAFFLSAIGVGSLINSIAIDRKRTPPVPLVPFFLLIVLALVTGIIQVGLPSSYWSFPLPLAYRFVCRRREERLIELIFLASVLPAAYWYLPIEYFLRFAFTLVMVCLLTHLLVRVILDLQRKLVLQSFMDPLTGIQNRQGFTVAIDLAIENQLIPDNPPILMLLDIDHFKQINDQHGHDVGDDVLLSAAELFRELVIPSGQVYRLGGEEFAFLFSQQEWKTTIELAESIRQQVAEKTAVAGTPVTVSLGISAYLTRETAAEWFKRTDVLLYAAKEQGRNRVVWDNQNQPDSIASP